MYLEQGKYQLIIGGVDIKYVRGKICIKIFENSPYTYTFSLKSMDSTKSLSPHLISENLGVFFELKMTTKK